jgi:hypothetical protein
MSFSKAILGVCLAVATAQAVSAQKVEVPATADKPARTLYIEWACDGKAGLHRGAKGALPDAPSVDPNLPLIDGRFYRQCTGKQQFAEYTRDTFGVRSFLAAGVRAGIEQYSTVPTGWGQDMPGYGQRYGSAFAEAAIDNTVRFGMAAVFHEDVRFLICHRCSAKDKLQNALLMEFTARHGADGHRTLSATPLIAGFSGPLIAYTAWYPPGYTPSLAAQHSALGFGTRIGFHLLREFLFDRDTKEEKAARKASTTAPPAP